MRSVCIAKRGQNTPGANRKIDLGWGCHYDCVDFVYENRFLGQHDLGPAGRIPLPFFCVLRPEGPMGDRMGWQRYGTQKNLCLNVASPVGAPTRPARSSCVSRFGNLVACWRSALQCKAQPPPIIRQAIGHSMQTNIARPRLKKQSSSIEWPLANLMIQVGLFALNGRSPTLRDIGGRRNCIKISHMRLVQTRCACKCFLLAAVRAKHDPKGMYVRVAFIDSITGLSI